MRKNFKLPRETFSNFSDFLKYKIGFLKLAPSEKLIKIANLLAKKMELDEMLYIRRHDHSLPPQHGYEALRKGKVLGFGLDMKDRNLSMSKMLGEYIERYEFKFPSYYPVFEKFSIKDLRKLFNVNFTHDYNNYTDLQKEHFSTANIDENKKVSCTVVLDIANNRKLFYPSQSIFYGDKDAGDGFYIAPQNSTGTATGFTRDQAILGAIYEIIERDAFLLHWLNKTPGKKIKFQDNDDEEILNLIKNLNRYGLKVTFFEISSDLEILTILTVIEDTLSTGKKMGICASSGSDAKKVMLSNLREAYQLCTVFKQDVIWEDYVFDRNKPFIDDDLTQEKRTKLLYKNNTKEIDFMWEGGEILFSELNKNDKVLGEKEELKFLIQKLKSKIPNLNIYSYTSKNPLLKRIGFYAVRVIIPQLLPFNLKDYQAMPISIRTRNFLDFKGLKETQEINPFPHPFP